MIGVTIHPVVAAKHEEIAALCRELRVQRLDVFGSVGTDRFDVDHSNPYFREQVLATREHVHAA
jgi:hypothetical protein